MLKIDNINSISHKKGLLLINHMSEVIPRINYLVVKTPSNQKYISANFVLFRNPPTLESVREWPEIFEKEFSGDPNIKHIKLEWDSSERNQEVLDAFVKEGFSLEEYETLILEELRRPERFKEEIEVREIDYAGEWGRVVEQQMLFRSESLSVEYYEEFNQTLMKFYKKLIDQGDCKWFGAYIDGDLVGSLGILWSDEMVGFQRVVVEAKFQGKGVCSTLMHKVCEWIQNKLPNRMVVIWAEQNSASAKIYRSCGFKFHEELLSINKYPDSFE